MGVCEDGRFAGSLSGGCIEDAVVAEARAALAKGKPHLVRFGAGSPYIDIKLPCGGGLDIHFQPLADSHFVDACRAAISSRQPFTVKISSGAVECLAGWQAARFDAATSSGLFGHWPNARLLIIGHGAGVEALAKLGQSMDCEIAVLTPDRRVQSALNSQAIDVSRLERTSDTHVLQSDPWAAIIFLFHDHDWEITLMEQALALPHFYIGAMGGRQAHRARCDTLHSRGVSAAAIASIHAPIGLFHSSRDPQTLALSALGEVIQTYQNTDFEAAIG